MAQTIKKLLRSIQDALFVSPTEAGVKQYELGELIDNMRQQYKPDETAEGGLREFAGFVRDYLDDDAAPPPQSPSANTGDECRV